MACNSNDGSCVDRWKCLAPTLAASYVYIGGGGEYSKLMLRTLAPALVILVAVISLGSMVFVTVQRSVTVESSSPTIVTAVNTELLEDYSTSTISCPGTPPTCFMQVYPFTYHETWSGQTTQVVIVHSTSIGQIQFVASGLGGDVGVALALALLCAAIVLLLRGRLPTVQ